jgi:hypothetical protein
MDKHYYKHSELADVKSFTTLAPVSRSQNVNLLKIF